MCYSGQNFIFNCPNIGYSLWIALVIMAFAVAFLASPNGHTNESAVMKLSRFSDNPGIAVMAIL